MFKDRLKWRPGRHRSVDKAVVDEPEHIDDAPRVQTLPEPPALVTNVAPKISNQRRESEPHDIGTGPQSPPSVPTRANTTIPERNHDIIIDDSSLEPEGLELLYEPEISPQLDIIFVHGSGGGSLATWSMDGDLDKCWPKRWLPAEPRLRNARLLSFGYNPVYGRSNKPLDEEISTAARQLLDHMKSASTDRSKDFLLGQRPILFVAHSTGGLVVKQTYLLAQSEEGCREILTWISAIMFLAVPNRGTKMASVLGRILSVSLPGKHTEPSGTLSDALLSASELARSVNDQFKIYAPRLEILSYYEQLETTSASGRSLIIVDANDSKLDTYGEFAIPLEADHISMCKFGNSRDSNYAHLRNGLYLLIGKIRAKGFHLVSSRGHPGLEHLEILLSIPDSYSEDLEFFRKRWVEGTCSWILTNEEWSEWKNEAKGSSMLWLHALPGSGKSILSSFVVHHLQEEAFCVYYFFRFGDQSKRSLATCLRILAFQIAERLPQFRRALQDLRLPTKNLEKTDAQTIWDKVFKDILFRMRTNTVQYWIIDALDEADHPQTLATMMEDVSRSLTPIKALLVSRHTPELVTTFERLETKVPVVYLPLADTKRDIKNFLEKEVKYVHAPPEFRTQIVERLVAGAGGNFLWARLAFDEVKECNTQEELDETLVAMPTELTSFYERMERTLIQKLQKRPKNQKLGHDILTWTVCSRRPLSIGELVQALQPESVIAIDAKLTIARVCGQFVVANATDHLVMVHQTARDHILSTTSALAVNAAEGHGRLFEKCLHVLETRYSRYHPANIGSSQTADVDGFILYATSSWPYHLDHTSADSNRALLALSKFLASGSVRAWIITLASKNMLRMLVLASKSLSRLARITREKYRTTNPMLHHLEELDQVELWAVDFLKLLGKFGQSLVSSPASINNHIPPFCPKDTAIYRHFERHNVDSYGLSVEGLSTTHWDDCLARLSLGSGSQALAVLGSSDHVAILTGVGKIVVYNAITFELIRTMVHGERVCAMALSRSSKHLATYGFRTTKIWDMKSGATIYTIANPRNSRAITMVFSVSGFELIAGSDDRVVRIANLADPAPVWSIPHANLLKEEVSFDRATHNVPWRMKFSPDAVYVAVSYRAFPLSIFKLDPPGLVGRCMRTKSLVAGNPWSVVDDVSWHPNSQEIVGMYQGGHIFRWNPFENTQKEIVTEAKYVTCSPDGNFFATGDRYGTVRLFSYEHFSLVYKLAMDGNINNLEFSPDGKRLFDVRGHYCNVWEPNVLIRIGDGGDEASDAASELPAVSIMSEHAVPATHSKVRDQITAIAIQPQGKYQAIGDEKGVVSLVDTLHGDHRSIELWKSPIQLPIGHLAWSEDCEYLACSELAGQVLVKKLQQEANLTWTSINISSHRLHISAEGVLQLFLKDDGSKLFVRNGPEAIVFDVGSIPQTSCSIDSLGLTWHEHPSNSDLLVAYRAEMIQLHRWDDLSMLTSMPIDGASALKHNMSIQRILRAFRSRQMVVHSQQVNGEEFTTSFFDMPNLDAFSAPGSLPVGLARNIPVDVEKQIEMPLGILPVTGFVFFDTNYWVCSYKLCLENKKQEVQKHYFLPIDWRNEECLRLCSLLANGTLLIPNNGELAVIKCLGLK